jgi:predicted DsbA family dithiol-disulfide isomerase
LAELQQNHDVEFVWLPYELRPEPEPLPDMSGANLERFQGNWERGVKPLAERYGMEMSFPPVKPRSRWAHEAAEFARDRGQFDAFRDALFRAYFVANRDIGDQDVLADVAASVGLDGDELRAALADGRYTERVQDLKRVSAQLGISAVPTMIFADAVAVQGAQPYSVLRQAYEMAQEQTAKEAAGQPAAD